MFTLTTSTRARASEMPVDWDAYALEYDHLLLQNPAYLDVLSLFASALRQSPPPPGAAAVDIGSGTGNLAAVLSHVRPDLHWFLLDPSAAMQRAAARKLRGRAVTPLRSAADDVDLTPIRPHLITLMHSLYTLPDPLGTLRRCAQALEPGGLLLLCDIGRPLNVTRWATYLARTSVTRQGVRATIRLLRATGQVRAQNRAIHAAQRAGHYWLHSPSDLRAAVQASGLTVLEQRLAYRGDSDFLVATRPGRAGQP
ncbi:class I SAM-dependent methyltransferase [Deinococcus sp. PEB2-63]